LVKDIDKHFSLPKGYYGLMSIFILLAFMALARIQSLEGLRYHAPGEWGKLLGLDRIPEVKTLRSKIKYLSHHGKVEEWGGVLCKEWMSSSDEMLGAFYVDSHVRVYHGEKTALPKHYVAREKLCLRATVDYWVNAMDGQPFFVINKAVDPGLLQVLEHEIVPQLKSLANNETNPEGNNITLIFDREGYSPEFMARMKEQSVACITYHKYPKDLWGENEFSTHEIKTCAGNIMNVNLAERGTLLPNKLWVREIRKKTQTSHQVPVISTDYKSDLKLTAVKMFSRWCQENYFKYMREHYGLDRLIDYSLEDISDTTKVVNPEYRRLDGDVRKYNAKLSRARAEFASIHLKDDISSDKIEFYESKKTELQTTLIDLVTKLTDAKQKRKNTERHIPVSELPEDQRFKRLSHKSKYLVDTVKMVAYRAETAMANILRESLKRQNDARSLVRSIYQTEEDIIPNLEEETLTVYLHHAANKLSDDAIQNLCHELNETCTKFPGTNLSLIYKLGSSQNP
jgi:hypothetical protein